MSFFQSARQTRAHAQVAQETCPWCEQPISHAKFEDIQRRMTVEHDERLAQFQAQVDRDKAAAELKARAALEQVRKDANAALEQRVAAAQSAAKQAAEAAMLARLGEMQVKLAEAERHQQSRDAEIKSLREEQQAAIDVRVQEARAALENEKAAAVLAEKAKVLKLQTDLQDLQRKLEGKSAHELGESSELDLFEEIKAAFEGDCIWRVGKGVNGADVIHEVVQNGQVCGKIIYDAKNRNAWQNEFVTKLRADKIAQAADHAILSSNRFPKDKAHVHYQDGVIVAAPGRVTALVQLLRDQVVRMHELRVSKEGREQKSIELYAFITSEHCRQLVDQIEAQAGRMLDLDTKEQEAHRRLWDQRKKPINSLQKARSDLTFEIDRIIGVAGNGPQGAD